MACISVIHPQLHSEYKFQGFHIHRHIRLKKEIEIEDRAELKFILHTEESASLDFKSTKGHTAETYTLAYSMYNCCI